MLVIYSKCSEGEFITNRTLPLLLLLLLHSAWPVKHKKLGGFVSRKMREPREHTYYYTMCI